MRKDELRTMLVVHEKCRHDLEHSWITLAIAKNDLVCMSIESCLTCSLKRGQVLRTNYATGPYIYDDTEVDYSEVVEWF